MPLKPYRRGPGLNDPAADFAEQIQKLPLLNGVLLLRQKTSGLSGVTWVKHGLGQSFVMASGSQDEETHPLVYLTPDRVQTLKMDPRVWFGVQCPAAVVVTFNCWVF